MRFCRTLARDLLLVWMEGLPNPIVRWDIQQVSIDSPIAEELALRSPAAACWKDVDLLLELYHEVGPIPYCGS